MDNISCDILVDAGNLKQMILGVVEITAKTEIAIQHAFIEIYGISSCQFTLDKILVKFPKFYKKGTKFRNEEKIYFSRHFLIKEDQILHFQHGTKYYNFKCRLPHALPGTWKSTHGEIKYMGKVSIKNDKGQIHVHLQEIVIKPNLDLTKMEYLTHEAHLEIDRIFRFGAIKLGNVQVQLWLPISGIAAGQSLPLLCTIINNSKIHFGGIIFVLTKKEIYRSRFPVKTTKVIRQDICRIPRMVDILKGKSEFYCVLQTDKNALPTNQFWKSRSCHVIYEVWVSIQGTIPKYSMYGYPNIDTPGIPVVIGTEPIKLWNCNKITAEVMGAIFDTHPPVIMEPPPPDDEVEILLQTVEEELDEKTIDNLDRQIIQQENAVFCLESIDMVTSSF